MMMTALRLPSPLPLPLFYAGIGSRETPDCVCWVMRRLGRSLAELEITLRSGGAKKADSAFEAGCDEAQGPKEIFLPWPGFKRPRGNSHPL